MRIKLLFILLFVCGSTAGWIYWQLNSNLWVTQKSQISQQLTLQASTLRTAVESELKIISSSVENGILKSYQPQVLASGVYDSKSSVGFIPATVSEGFDFQKVGPSVQIALKESKSNLDRQIWMVLDSQKIPTIVYLWTTYAVNPPATYSSVVLLRGDFFQNLFQSFNDSQGDAFLANRDGQSLAHSNKDYLGINFSDHFLVEKWKNEESSLAQIDIGSSLGVYEGVSGSNFSVFTTIDSKKFLSNWALLKTQSLFISAGVFVLGVVLLLLFYKPEVRLISAGQLAAAPPVPKVKVAPENYSEKVNAYTKVASSIAYGVNGPLTSLLSQIRLLRTKVQQVPELSGGFDQALKKMEDETREGREILNKLLVFAGERMSSPSKASLQTVVRTAVKNFENRFSAKGVKLEVQLSEVSLFDFPEDLMLKAIENLLLNALEAVERQPKKEITVRLEQRGDLIELSIKDTGEGIAPENIHKITDPFFTTRQLSQKIGLGLSMAHGVVRASNGKLLFSSKLNEGTIATLVFDLKSSPIDLTIKQGRVVSGQTSSQLDKDIVDDMLEEINLEANKNIEVQKTVISVPAAPVKLSVDSRITPPKINLKPRQNALEDLLKKDKQ